MSSVQRIAFSNLSSDFNHNNLYNEGQKSDENEDAVSENSSEDVEFSKLEKSSIELIEKLHEYEDLEHVSEVNKLLSSGVLWNISWEHDVLGPVSRFLKLFAGLFILEVGLLINKAAE